MGHAAINSWGPGSRWASALSQHVETHKEIAISMGFIGEYWVNDDLGIHHDLRNHHFYVGKIMINQYEPV